MEKPISRPKYKVPKDKFLCNNKFTDVSSWINLDQEWAGTREKYILKPNEKSSRYLIKFPEYGENEIYTELFNSYLAMSFGLNVASYFPCLYKNKKGIIVKRFLDEQKNNEELWEMKELICEYSGDIGLGKKLGRDKVVLKEHDIDNIVMILNEEFGSKILHSFFKMIGFDCLIGHSDRHWENYGIILTGDKDHNLSYRFAPLYDTATSFLVGWSEDKIKQILKSGELDDPLWYRPTSKKNTCRITINGNPRTNHMDLLEHIINNTGYAKYLTSLFEPINKYNEKTVRYILRNFCKGLSQDRKNVIIKILSMRHALISEIINKER
ncbi:HipA domain-containing protein [Halobacteriovorax sp. YZS-1-1]|uniref:HipA domain-containing protein n=1 Tax=unclassified Halobacteriovorax TaxID=2639665 RepID=UPI00399AFA5A